MGEAEVTAEMIGAGLAAWYGRADFRVDEGRRSALAAMYRAMRALDPEIEHLEEIRDAYEEAKSAAEDRRFC